MIIHEVSVQELQALKESGADFILIDVRDAWENEICNLDGVLIPLKELPDHLNEFDPEQHIIVHCQMGGRSSRAAQYLMENGFKNVSNLRGGIKAWATEIDPNMKMY
jgi:rhodanese-related sulfurtransferase